MRKVPAEVRMLSTTPVLFGPTTVERFICARDRAGTKAEKTVGRPHGVPALTLRHVSLQTLDITAADTYAYAPNGLVAAARTCGAASFRM